MLRREALALKNFNNGPNVTLSLQGNNECRSIWLQVEGPGKNNAASLVQRALDRLSSEEPKGRWPEAVGQLLDEQLRQLSGEGLLSRVECS